MDSPQVAVREQSAINCYVMGAINPSHTAGVKVLIVPAKLSPF